MCSVFVLDSERNLQAVQQLGGGVGIAALTTLYVAGLGGGADVASAASVAHGVGLAMLGGAGFTAIALVLYAIWGTRVTPKAATAADVEAELSAEAELEASAPAR